MYLSLCIVVLDADAQPTVARLLKSGAQQMAKDKDGGAKKKTNSISADHLRMYCKHAGLRHSGTKAELLRRYGTTEALSFV